MPSLTSMRQIEPEGKFQPLGKPIEQFPEPTPLHRPTQTPGVVQLPDGKLATNLPTPLAKSPASKAMAGDWSPETFANLFTALSIAAERKEYPRDGLAWTPNKLTEDKRPVGVTWAVLSDGTVLPASQVYYWPSRPNHSCSVAGYK